MYNALARFFFNQCICNVTKGAAGEYSLLVPFLEYGIRRPRATLTKVGADRFLPTFDLPAFGLARFPPRWAVLFFRG